MKILDQYKKGFVEVLLLSLLENEDLYGSQMTKKVSESSQNIINVPEGSLYPSLYKLIDNGLVSDKKRTVGRRSTRVYYHLEPKGVEYLIEAKKAYGKFVNAMNYFLSDGEA